VCDEAVPMGYALYWSAVLAIDGAGSDLDPGSGEAWRSS